MKIKIKPIIYTYILIISIIPDFFWIQENDFIISSRTFDIMSIIIYILFISSLILKNKKMYFSKLSIMFMLIAVSSICIGIINHNLLRYIIIDIIGISIIVFYDQVNNTEFNENIDINKIINVFLVGYTCHLIGMFMIGMFFGRAVSVNLNFLYFILFLILYKLKTTKKIIYIILMILYIIMILYRAKRMIIIYTLYYLILFLIFTKKKITYMIYITIGIIISIVLLRTLFNNFYYTYSNYLMSRFAEFNNYSSTTDVSVYKYAIDQIGYFIKHNNFLVVMLGDGAGTLLNINFTNNSLISMNGQNFFIDNLYTTLIFKFGIIGIVFAILIYFTLIKKSYRIYFYNKHNENINLLCFGILNYCILDFLTLFVGLGVFYSRFYTILLIIMVILDKTTISRNKS